MENLWAPWRLEYILGDKDGECFLCHILAAEPAHDRKNLVLRRGKTCAVVLNRYPYNNGHLLVCPCRHIGEMGLMNGHERLEMMDLVAESIEALQTVIHPDGFNTGMNLGRVAGAGLEAHVHNHVVPRWNGDTNFMPVIADVKIVPQYLEDLWDRLHPVMNS